MTGVWDFTPVLASGARSSRFGSEDKRVVISGTAGKEIEIITRDAFITQKKISLEAAVQSDRAGAAMTVFFFLKRCTCEITKTPALSTTCCQRSGSMPLAAPVLLMVLMEQSIHILRILRNSSETNMTSICVQQCGNSLHLLLIDTKATCSSQICHTPMPSLKGLTHLATIWYDNAVSPHASVKSSWHSLAVRPISLDLPHLE
ncbi:hypothetical protein Trydic_g1492 [Trypoxylus dichotomus]